MEDPGQAVASSSQQDPGKQVYSTYCRNCHGSNGDLGLSGAANLMESNLPKEELTDIISNGRNNMQSFKGLLSEKQIDRVSDYIITLRKSDSAK